MRNWRPRFVVATFPVAALILYTMVLHSSSRTPGADPPAPQMMGNMGKREMTQAIMRDNVPPGVRSEDLPAPNSEGARLTAHYCVKCHGLASPSMHTAKEWKMVANRMFRRMLMMERRGMMGMKVSMPPAGQERMILAYLEAHALKSISPSAFGSPSSSGAVAFQNSYSECHALPNPKQYGTGDWPAVVKKMQSYAKQLGKKEITNQQAKEIDLYLANYASH